MFSKYRLSLPAHRVEAIIIITETHHGINGMASGMEGGTLVPTGLPQAPSDVPRSMFLGSPDIPWGLAKAAEHEHARCCELWHAVILSRVSRNCYVCQVFLFVVT